MKSKYDIVEIQMLYDTGLSLREVSAKIGISLPRLSQLSKQGKLTTRTKSEAMTGKTLSDDTKAKLRDHALKQGFGGYKPNAGRSKREYRTDSNGNQILLQSSYEVRLADILSSLGFNWIRPSSLPYRLEEKDRRYFPDFLINDKFLVDTKNSYLALKDKPKIQAVERQNGVQIIILLEKDLTEDIVKSLFTVV